jgi:DNA mismatch endonuclease, patch repair protein
MADTVSRSVRSHIMASVKQKHTKPELIVRSYLHNLGFRFRVQRKDLPGSPDIILPKHRTVIFVHGCFWHQHQGCTKARRPTSNQDYWDNKLSGNVQRDKKKTAALRKLGWNVITVWECETKDLSKLQKRLRTIISNYIG